MAVPEDCITTAAYRLLDLSVLRSVAAVQLLLVASLTADGNIWGSSSAVVVFGVYVAQVCFNAVSHHVAAGWGNPIAQNLVGLAIFVAVSATMLYLHVRAFIRVWAEALSVNKITNPRQIR